MDRLGGQDGGRTGDKEGMLLEALVGFHSTRHGANIEMVLRSLL